MSNRSGTKPWQVQIVIPRIAEAMGVSMDPSFVAFVPIGGRHAQHLWKLVVGLGIPCLTLLDFDLGRFAGGMGRIKNAVTWLKDIGYKCDPDKVPGNKALETKMLQEWVNWLRSIGVYYSSPLDLDMMMIKAFTGAYVPSRAFDAAKDDPAKIAKTVFGDSGPGNVDLDRIIAPFTAEELYTYKNLFKSRSKPASHYKALAALDDATITANCPEPLRALIETARTILNSPPPVAAEAEE